MTIPPNKDRIIIYGEAPESDDEDDQDFKEQIGTTNQIKNEQSIECNRNTTSHKVNKSSGQLLFSLTSSSSTLAKLFNYQPSSSLVNQMKKDDISPNGTISNLTSLSLLHKTLYVKNQQLRQCFEQLHCQPYEKMSHDLNSISQRLVDVQKTFQNIDSSLVKLRREQKNMDIHITRL